MHQASFALICLLFGAVTLALRTSHLWLKSVPLLRDCVFAVEDQWTWTTQDGRLFEGVEITQVVGDEVVIQHRSGQARLFVTSLSEESRERLFRTPLWGNEADAAARELAVLQSRFSQ